MINTRQAEYCNNDRKETAEHRHKKPQQNESKKRCYETLQGKADYRFTIT
jgi:hypothetical protein